ncbi:hypothetical protein M0D69_01400 [Caballeronia sp. SEWSISQ10-4 2]|uniref:hypothetical protein n=1 Tax=Caballeronia sp. SEWSISQ10-4 2 TaxID=2937438 RepID=UPI0026554FBF|nr:hypothetical protein [Caballeronia sp. SEWSISQ10-4 2]MDN7176696.1 hypothetical protein [Caballeronia sp. SEWSISQ10-4 2]
MKGAQGEGNAMKGRPGANAKKPRQSTNFIRNRGERPGQPPVAVTAATYSPGGIGKNGIMPASSPGQHCLPFRAASYRAFRSELAVRRKQQAASSKKRHGLQLRTQQ